MKNGKVVFSGKYRKMKSEIITGDCRDVLKSIPENSIDIIITSPPYNVGKDYKVLKENLSIQEYKNFTEQWIKECYRVLKDNGHLCLNLSATDKNTIYELHSSISKEVGFKIKEKIIWVKSMYPEIDLFASRKNITNSHRYGRLIMCYEAIIIFEKTNSILTPYQNKNIPESWKYNVWFTPPVKVSIHPAPFPKEIPRRLIKMYSKEGDIVLDPFLGTGTTMKVAFECSRSSIGIELNPEYVEIAKRRITPYTEIKTI